MTVTDNHSPLPIPLSPPHKFLEALIKHLKRSPESPSRLTLPPIMGVLEESDMDCSINEGSFDTSKGEGGGSETMSTGCGLGLSDMTEAEEYGMTGLGVGKLWTLEEVEELDDNPNGNAFVSSIPPYSPELTCDESLPPINPFSPPPPSPRLAHLLSPTLPDSPTFPFHDKDVDMSSFSPDTEVDQENDENIDPHSQAFIQSDDIHDHMDNVKVTEFDHTNEEEEVNLPISLDVEASSPTSPRLSIPNTGRTQRRRRRTLSDLEQYRKFAMTKSAYKLQHELEVAEEKRRQMERLQEMQRGLWISTRRKMQRSLTMDVDNGQPMMRAQSFPPCKSKPSADQDLASELLRANSSSQATMSQRDDLFSSTWSPEEEEYEHLEYASSGQDPTSPVSPILDTPRVRMNFPSAIGVFGQATEKQNHGLGLLGLREVAEVLGECEGGCGNLGGTCQLDDEARSAKAQNYPSTIGNNISRPFDISSRDEATSSHTVARSQTRPQARDQNYLRRGGIDLGDATAASIDENAMFVGFGIDWTLDRLDPKIVKPLLGLGLTSTSSLSLGSSIENDHEAVQALHINGVKSSDSTPVLSSSPDGASKGAALSILLTPPTPVIPITPQMACPPTSEISSLLTDSTMEVSYWRPRYVTKLARNTRRRRISSPNLTHTQSTRRDTERNDSTSSRTCRKNAVGRGTRSAPPSPKRTIMKLARREEREMSEWLDVDTE
ncbi:hypothetical protein CI109_102530 [Kwoniella shandongensis]|uniref:Uncharacterized protein n=1 Tax=Kwoniella shandongensis TaxID=1734106 RepID=A0AAJ8LHX5_9TREE